MKSGYGVRATKVFGAVLVCIGTVAPLHAAAPAASGKTGIAWQVASTEAEVDKAFAAARKSGKPVFLYWGAVWCPPCNQVKATLFSRPDFVERSRAFVAVYVDGDKAGAQKVASRYKVSGYPTMILFKPDGTEVTRLPGEVDPQRYLLALTTGLNAQVPVKELLRRAQAGQALTPEQWRLLAFYSWDTDEQQVVSNADLSRRLSELAAAAPADLGRIRERLAFKALAARARAASGPADSAALDADRKMIERILADTEASKELADQLIGQAERSVKHLVSAPEARKALASHWDAALVRLIDSGSLSRVDHIDAVDARVSLWKLIDGTDALGAERRTQVLREVARVVASTTDRYERQAVIPGAAHVLAQAGLLDESDSLLKAELPRAVAPYYHMLGLAGNAKKRGDKAAALQWYEQAWRKSEGSATRIQWGANYVGQVLDLTPADKSRISAAAGGVISGLEVSGETFHGRNQRSLERMASRLSKWRDSDASRAPVVDKLKNQLAKTCARLPTKEAGRDNCERVFSPSSAASS